MLAAGKVVVFYVLGQGIDWGSREDITVGEKPVKTGPGALFLILFLEILSLFLRRNTLFSKRIEKNQIFAQFGTGNELMICSTFWWSQRLGHFAISESKFLVRFAHFPGHLSGLTSHLKTDLIP